MHGHELQYWEEGKAILSLCMMGKCIQEDLIAGDVQRLIFIKFRTAFIQILILILLVLQLKFPKYWKNCSSITCIAHVKANKISVLNDTNNT